MEAEPEAEEPEGPSQLSYQELYGREPGPISIRQVPRAVRLSLGIAWRASPKDFTIALGVQALAGLGVGLQIVLVRALLGTLTHGFGANAGTAVALFVAVAATTTIINVSSAVLMSQQRLLADLVAAEAERGIIRAASSASLAAFDDADFYNRLQRAKAATQWQWVIAQSVLGIANTAVGLLSLVVVITSLQPVLLVALAVGLIPLWIANARGSEWTYWRSLELVPMRMKVEAIVNWLTGRDAAKEIRAFGLSEHLINRHRDMRRELFSKMRSALWRRSAFVGGAGLLSSLVGFAAIGFVVWEAATGRISLPAAGAALLAMYMVQPRLEAAVNYLGSMYETAMYLDDYEKFTELADVAVEPSGGEVAPPLEDIELRGVTFTYPRQRRPALVGVDFTIRRGEVVALVGENGSGKTTLAKILAGLYAPDAGERLWNGCDSAGTDPASIRDQVAVLFQDFMKYLMSAAENVAIGRPGDAGDLERVREAARMANIDSVLSGLPGGYETLLGPEFMGGRDLSIGQWQRVALARAFFRDAPLIILDEPTAALDPKAEHDLFETMRELFRGRAVLLISHRFSSVTSADRIYVLHHGRVEEYGSHEELMARQGRYADLFTLQASAYLRAGLGEDLEVS